MTDIHYKDLVDFDKMYFQGDSYFGGIFKAAIQAHETKTLPPAVSQQEYSKVLDAIGPSFQYTGRGDHTQRMVLCRLPLRPFSESLINTFRVYVVPYDDLLFYRSLLVDMPIN